MGVGVTQAFAMSIVCAAACGRVGFELIGSIGTDTDANGSANDAMPARISYVGPFVQRSPGTGATDSFTTRARGVGNAVVVQFSCAANAIPTAVSVTAPGWTWTQLGPITASMTSVQRSATFVAFAPDTANVTVNVAWTGSTCNSSKNHIGDEFAMIDPAGGAITFDGVNASEGMGDCVGTVTTGHAHDAVWAACNSQNNVIGIGAGFTKGADDNAGDWTEYNITADPAGTVQNVRFTNNNVGYVLSMVTLKPQ